jgi:methylated-DNA-[protein]-cysteine S-methyltransferase
MRTLGARSDVGFEEARRQLGEYFTGERHEFDLPLAPAGDELELGRACQGHGGSAFLR